MVILSYKLSILTLVCLIGGAQSSRHYTAGVYTVAVNYARASQDASCDKVADRILRVSTLAMHEAGMDLGQNQKHWRAFREEHVELLEEENREDKAAQDYNHTHPTSQRRLCDDFCSVACQTRTVYSYCQCCSCCATEVGKRNLRTKVKIFDGADLEKVASDAEEAAIRLLGQWHRHVECLAEPYVVEVSIVSVEGDGNKLEKGPIHVGHNSTDIKEKGKERYLIAPEDEDLDIFADIPLAEELGLISVFEEADGEGK